jgi:DnaJ-class molecular chaperone
MTRKKCPDCNGTGKELCPVHGSHICEKCNGKGCIEEDRHIPFPKPKWNPNWYVK